jgi:dolichol-phosphate mannosyltransferase
MSFETIKKILRYIISGGTGAVTDLAFLYIFVEYAGLWYIFSVILAFMTAFAVSFTLQKFWTFGDCSISQVYRQASTYFIISVINLGLNTFLVYVGVDFVGLHYLVSQFIAGGLLAFSSFFMYSIFVFRPKQAEKLVQADQPNDFK